MWRRSPNLASFPCGGSSAMVKGVNVSDAASYLNAAHPHPPLSANLLLSFTMKSMSCRLAGTVVPGNASCFFGFQWIFAILAPSGKGLPFPGIPGWEGFVISGLGRITPISFSFRLMERVCQPSYPLNSENASPFGTRTAYLAWAVSCAEMVLPPKTASTETASETTTITTARILLLFIATLLVFCGRPVSWASRPATAELIRVKRHEVPDAHRRPAGHPLPPVRQ